MLCILSAPFRTDVPRHIFKTAMQEEGFSFGGISAIFLEKELGIFPFANAKKLHL